MKDDLHCEWPLAGGMYACGKRAKYVAASRLSNGRYWRRPVCGTHLNRAKKLGWVFFEIKFWREQLQTWLVNPDEVKTSNGDAS